jgi:hypothetical protein
MLKSQREMPHDKPTHKGWIYYAAMHSHPEILTPPTHKQENECTEAALRYIWIKRQTEKIEQEPKKEDEPQQS